MIKFKCLGTGSKGNCYLLETESETLILDCGIPKKEIIEGLDYNVKKIKGVIVSHEHKDHLLAEKDLFAFDVWKPFESKKLNQKRTFGNFEVQSFELPHNGTQNCGFYIKVDDQKILYMTDFEYCKYNFKNLNINHMIIECNYDEVDSELPNYRHKILGHCSLETCKNFIEVNYTDRLKNVILVHMGQFPYTYSELLEKFKSIANKTNFYYAKAKLKIEFNK